MDNIKAQDLVGGCRDLTNLATAYWKSCVLFAANKLDMFTVIGARSVTANQIAEEMQLDTKGTEKLLNACVSQALMEKDSDHYTLAAISRRFLDQSSELYIGDWISHWADMLAKGNWLRLDEGIRTGGSVKSLDAAYGFDENKSPLINWLKGMHQTATAGHADLLVAATNLADAKSLLDVGGSSGAYSIAFCHRYPQLIATIVDSPDIAEAAVEFIEVAGMGERVKFVTADFRACHLRERYDVVLLSNVLHMYDRDNADLIMKNAVAHLASDGRILVQEWLMEDDGTSPALACLFNLHILINPGGDLYRRVDVVNMLSEAGCQVEQEVQTEGLYDIVIARKR